MYVTPLNGCVVAGASARQIAAAMKTTSTAAANFRLITFRRRFSRMQVSIASFSFHRSRAAGTVDVFGYLESCRYRYHLDTADIWNVLLGSDPNQYLDESFLAKVKR